MRFWIVGFATLSLAACRPDMTTPDVVTGTDSGRADTGVRADTGSGSDTGAMDTGAMDTGGGGEDVAQPDVQGTDAGSGADCSGPSMLHRPAADAGTANLYCPYSGVDGGRAQYCASGTEHCCEPTTGTAACQPLATACPTGNTDWQCEDPGADCPTGMSCCATGTLTISTDPACGNYASGFHGSHCAASCLATEIKLCTDSSECGAQTCVPFRAKGNQVGGCH